MKLTIEFDTEEERDQYARFIPEGLDLSNIQVSDEGVGRRIVLALRLLGPALLKRRAERLKSLQEKQ